MCPDSTPHDAICEQCNEPFVHFQSLTRGQRFCAYHCAMVYRVAHWTPKHTPEELFWRRVDKNGPIIRPELGPCWVWTGATDAKGYGAFYDRRIKRRATASRIAYEFEHGAVPEGKDICHHCDNPPCVRPVHLFPGTESDNQIDCRRKNRHSKLTVEQVKEIRELRSGGMKVIEIARIYGITDSSVSFACNGRTWWYVE